jgi:2-hydroxy-3-keto-5-methylthiopentenyl-1-phosphate phosphatase
VLEREGVELHVLANEVEARPEGWIVRWRDEAVCASCGEPCKRGGLAGESYAYVGDGYSDRCAALAADRVFARDALATFLDGEGVAYERFDDLREVATLVRGTPRTD